MDIVDRAVVSWVATAAGTSVEMIGDVLVDNSQRAGRCPGYDDRPVTARPSLPFVRYSSNPPAASLESRGMAMKSLEHDDARTFTLLLSQAMNSILKIVAVGAIFFGEALSIIAELIASRQFGKAGGHLTTLLPMFLLISVGGILLVCGYALGYMYLKSIWIIVAISVGAILVVEPILALLLFRDVPTVGSLIGLVFGALGTLAAIIL